MEKQIIITSGKKYIDIDAYGGIFAYKKLLDSLGYNTYAVTSAYINESVPKIITDLGFEFDKIAIKDDAEFIVLDVSNPDFFDFFVKEENITEIIDHHTGYENYWQSKNIKNQIEFIGSICTIIFERYIERNKESLLNSNLCKLLTAGILDNTLNLKTNNTTKRDIDAYNQLLKIGGLDNNWYETYFNSCYANIEENLSESIKNDTKIEKTSIFLPKVLGQLIVLDKNVIFNNIALVNQAFDGYDEWLFNVICLKDGKSYILFKGNNVKENLIKIFKGTIQDNCLILEKCLLRKEIIKLAKDFTTL